MKRFLLLAALLAAGCGRPPGWGEIVLDTRAPFPDLEGAAPQPAADERAVPLAGVLAASLPREGWRTYAGSGLTVLSRVGPDGSPDALIWAEAFSSLADRSPSQELRRFLLTVDPALVRRSGSWPTVSPGPGFDREAVAAAMTRTGGRGLGFASSAQGFSGWRWVGSNAMGVYLRLASSRGTWGETELLPARLRNPVERLVERIPRLEWLRSGLPVQEGGAQLGREPAPAAMVFGSAAAEDGSVHLALLCRRAPACAPAPDLARFLGTLRPLETPGDGQEVLPLAEMSYELGLEAVPADALLDPFAALP
jgi:hypothetical protein